MMNPRPLKTRLVLWTVFVGGFSVAIFGWLITSSLEAKMRQRLDDTLRGEAESIFAGIRGRSRAMNWNDTAEVTKFFSTVYSLYSFEIEQPPGKLVYRSGELGDVSLPPGPEGFADNVNASSGVAVRILQITRGDLRVRAAMDAKPFIDWETNVWQTYAILVPLSVMLLALGARVLYGKALKPVDDIAAAAERITADRLDKRLPVHGNRDELGHLTAVLNRMIERLQQSFELSRRFSADASHELKTPLTIIRGELEIALRSGEIPDAVERTMLDLLDETGRLIHIVEGLLLLSQADAGKLPFVSERVEFTTMIGDLADDIEILADRQGVKVELHLAPGICVKGSPQFLRQVVLNLFDNAIKYNRPEGTIRCSLEAAGEMAVFRIANTGADIPGADRERVFSRFYRVETSRTRGPSGGQGLGLSIAREIVRAHGGTLTLEDTEPGWTQFQFTIPLCADAAPGQRAAAAQAAK